MYRVRIYVFGIYKNHRTLLYSWFPTVKSFRRPVPGGGMAHRKITISGVAFELAPGARPDIYFVELHRTIRSLWYLCDK